MEPFSIPGEIIFIAALAVLVGISLIKWKRDLQKINQLKSEIDQDIVLSNDPKVSFLIPAWNNSNTISQCIESFNKIKYSNKELIVIAGGEDDTYGIAKKYESKDIKIIEQRPSGKNAALNDGFKHSTGEIIILTDADCILSDNWFKSIIHPIINELEDVTTGGSIPLKSQLSNSFVLQQFSSNVYNHLHFPKYVSGILGRNAAVKREVLEEIGGFDETALTGADYNLAKHIKKKFKIRWVPESAIETEYSTKFLSYINQQSRWLRSTYIIGKQFGDRNEVIKNGVSSIVGAGMLLLPFSTLVIGTLGIYLWLTLLAVAFMNRVRYLEFSKRVYDKIDFNSVYLKILIYMYVDFIAWTFALLDYLIPWRRRKW